MQESKSFKSALQQVFDSIENFMELTRESVHPMVTEDGVQTYLEDTGKLPFQVADQFQRPNEYLRCLLDMIQANFEPDILGTFFLNSNMSFLYESLPAKSFSLGYLSLMKFADEDWEQFRKVSYANKVKDCNYIEQDISSTFLVVSAGKKYSFELIEETSETFNSNLNTNEAITILRGQTVQKQFYVGYCQDRSLNQDVRVSAWFILDK